MITGAMMGHIGTFFLAQCSINYGSQEIILLTLNRKSNNTILAKAASIVHILALTNGDSSSGKQTKSSTIGWRKLQPGFVAMSCDRKLLISISV